MVSISSMLISVSVREKKPSVSAAWTSCVVISSIRLVKSAREMRGMLRSAYFVAAGMSVMLKSDLLERRSVWKKAEVFTPVFFRIRGLAWLRRRVYI